MEYFLQSVVLLRQRACEVYFRSVWHNHIVVFQQIITLSLIRLTVVAEKNAKIWPLTRWLLYPCRWREWVASRLGLMYSESDSTGLCKRRYLPTADTFEWQSVPPACLLSSSVEPMSKPSLIVSDRGCCWWSAGAWPVDWCFCRWGWCTCYKHCCWITMYSCDCIYWQLLHWQTAFS